MTTAFVLSGGASVIDHHELLTLLDRGCPPALAARIVAALP
jgi:hypothetical protein